MNGYLSRDDGTQAWQQWNATWYNLDEALPTSGRSTAPDNVTVDNTGSFHRATSAIENHPSELISITMHHD